MAFTRRFQKLGLTAVLLFAVTWTFHLFGTLTDPLPDSAGLRGRPLGAGDNIAAKHNKAWNSLQPMLLWHSPKAAAPLKTSDLREGFPPFGEVEDEPLEQCFSMSEEDVLELRPVHDCFIANVARHPPTLYHYPGTRGLVNDRASADVS